jgi:hypothetical protein
MRKANVMAGAVAGLWFAAFVINRSAWSAATDTFEVVDLGPGEVDLQLLLPLLAVAAILLVAWICNTYRRWDNQLAFLSVVLGLALIPYAVASVGVV